MFALSSIGRHLSFVLFEICCDSFVLELQVVELLLEECLSTEKGYILGGVSMRLLLSCLVARSGTANARMSCRFSSSSCKRIQWECGSERFDERKGIGRAGVPLCIG